MKALLIVCLGSLFFAGSSLAEPRTFTSKDGKTLSAELERVDGEEAVLKLANLKRVKVPLASLSDSDQKFIKSWWEKNKNNISDFDLRLSIEKKIDRVSRPGDDKGIGTSTVKKGGKKGGGQNVTVDEVEYHCVLDSYTPRELTGITVEYTLYKRIINRTKEGSTINTETTDGKTTIASIPGNRSVTFETSSMTCEDVEPKATRSKAKGKKGGKMSRTPKWPTKSETALGVVIRLSANGKEFLVQSYPEGLADKLGEAEERGY